MKKLYQEFFCIPEQGKVSDKVLLVRMAAAALFMVLCLCGMSASAYAYFTCSVSSASNVIQAAEFKAEVTISDQNNNNVSVDVTTTDNRTFSANLQAGQYTVSLTPQGTATTGFFIITVDGVSADHIYYTQQLVENDDKKPLSFTLVLAEPAAVTLLAHWGTVSSYPEMPANSITGENNRIAPFGEWTLTSSENETEDETQEELGVSTHTVLAGETADSIAQKYGVAVEKLLAYNEIADIKEGDVLKIPPADWKPEVKTEEPEQQTGQMATDTPATDLNQESGENEEQQEEQPDNGTNAGTDNTNTGDAT